jgi:hypothetical protein
MAKHRIQVTVGGVTFDPRKPLPPKKYWAVIGDQWTSAENISDEYEYWLGVWRSDVPHREVAMPEADRKFFEGLPDMLTIYRGVGVETEGDAEGALMTGLSWTLSRDKAIWFAHRLGYGVMRSLPFIAEATIQKKDCFAYFSDRDEQEVVIDPDRTLTFEMEKLKLKRKARP